MKKKLLILTILLATSFLPFDMIFSEEYDYQYEISEDSSEYTTDKIANCIPEPIKNNPMITNIIEYVNCDYVVIPNHTYRNACLAIFKGLLDDLKMFIEKEPNIITASSSDGNSLLHLAILAKDSSIISYLIEKGIPTNLRNKEGKTPLHIAAFTNNIRAANILIEQGASTRITDIYGHTPIWIANIKHHSEMLELLIEAQKKEPYTEQIKKMIREQLKKGTIQTRTPVLFELYKNIPQNLSDNKLMMSTLWHKALYLRGYGEAEKLIQFGVTPLEKDKLDRTPLHIAALYNNIDGLQYLLTLPFEITKDLSGSTALHIAAAKTSPKFMCLLLNIGCDIYARNNKGRTPLFEAVLSGNKATILYILKQGISPNIRNSEGRTVLHEAARLGDKEITTILLRFGALYNISDYQGKTPLYLAAEQGYVEIVELLYEKGADINTVNYQKISPLEIAVINNQKEIVQYLITRKNIDMQQKKAATDLAKKRGLKSMLNILI